MLASNLDVLLSDSSEWRMRLTAVIAPLLAALSLCRCGGAPAAPWCAQYSTGLNDCSFYSFQQCTTAVSGVGGICTPNQFRSRRRAAQG
jgi:hypothetical protein